MALTLVACFAGVAEACAKPLMAAFETSFTNVIIPSLQNCCSNILQGSGLIIRQPIPEQIPEAPMNDNHMILAKDLTIHDPKYTHHWELKIDPKDTRFKETKLLKRASQSWEIKASISFDDFHLANKTYRVYLIFKPTDDSAGLDAVLTATVSTEIDDVPKDVCLSLKPKADADQMSDDIKLPGESSYEEWMELELGEFLCSYISAKRVAKISIKVKESGKHLMRGVYVAGIELRPKSY